MSIKIFVTGKRFVSYSFRKKNRTATKTRRGKDPGPNMNSHEMKSEQFRIDKFPFFFFFSKFPLKSPVATPHTPRILTSSRSHKTFSVCFLAIHLKIFLYAFRILYAAVSRTILKLEL